MNEDLKPCLDIESLWELSPDYPRTVRMQIFKHKDYKNLLRIVDFKEQVIIFRDTHRVKIQGVIDINKKLHNLRRANLANFLNRIMDAEKPISMPYVPENIKVYIEDIEKGHEEILGVLYYMDSDPEKTIVPIKRYFERNDRSFKYEEIPFDKYQEMKERLEEDVDQTQ